MSCRRVLSSTTQATIEEFLDAFYMLSVPIKKKYYISSSQNFLLFLCNRYTFRHCCTSSLNQQANILDRIKAVIMKFINIHPYSSINVGWGVIRDNALNMAAIPVNRNGKHGDNDTLLRTYCTVMSASAVKFPTGVTRWHPCHQLSRI
jgi:hypothetical protein